MGYVVDSLNVPDCYVCHRPAQYRLYDGNPSAQWIAPDGFTRLSQSLPTIFLCAACLSQFAKQVPMVQPVKATVDILDIPSHFTEGVEFEGGSDFQFDPFANMPKRPKGGRYAEQAIDNAEMARKDQLNLAMRKAGTAAIISNYVQVLSKDPRYKVGCTHISIFAGRKDQRKFYIAYISNGKTGKNRRAKWALLTSSKEEVLIRDQKDYDMLFNILHNSPVKPDGAWWMIVNE